MSDDQKKIAAIEAELKKLGGQLPSARTGLSEAEKDLLVKNLGYRTIKSILKAKSEFQVSRIPFLFSALDTQAVVDVLANEMRGAVDRAELSKKHKQSKPGHSKK